MKTIFTLSIIFILSLFQQAIANEWSIGIGNTGLQFKNSKKNESSPFYSAYYLYENRDTSINDSTNHQLGLEIGYRSYLEISEINKFMDSSFQYVNIDYGDLSDITIYRLKFMYGIENYITENVSIEGSTGMHIEFFESDSSDATSIFVPVAKISINYRF